MLSNDQIEALARLAHSAYLRRLTTPPAGEPARLPWGELSSIYQEQNRDQVRQQERWLLDHGMAIVGGADVRPGVGLPEINDLLEEYGKDEHKRWMRALYADGWTAGPRDEVRKTHPCFVPWDELAKTSKDKDRAPLREFSDHLAQLDLRIVKVADVA